MKLTNYNYAEGKNPPLSSAEVFWLVYLVILILGYSSVFTVKHFILKSQIEQAVFHFAEEYCGVKLEEVKIHIDVSLLGKDDWNASTVPEIEGIWGYINYDGLVTLSCGDCLGGGSLDLDKKSRRFFNNPEPRDSRGWFDIDLTGFYRFIFFIFLGFIIRFCMVAYREEAQAKMKRKLTELQDNKEDGDEKVN